MVPAVNLVERFRGDLAAVAPAARRIAIAVSGGADSLALLLLAVAAEPGRIQAATVDHGLRPEGAAEAVLAADVCRSLAVPHRTLAVAVVSAGSGLQAAARDARYAALAEWMREEGLDTLLTAHHADDQAETLVMRLLRGSGVAGLAGIRAGTAFPAAGAQARLCRPLLGWRRDELAAIVAGAGLAAALDPSNDDETFDRVRIRRLLAAAPWLDPLALARSASALGEAEEALVAIAEHLWRERAVTVDGRVTLDPADLPREIVRRLVLRALRAVDPAPEPRGEPLSALIARLHGGGTATLAGVKCHGGTRFLFEPAPPRRRPDRNQGER